MQRIEGQRKVIIYRRDQLDRLSKINERHNITEAEVFRMIMDIGLDAYELCGHVGIPQFAEKGKWVRNWLKELRSPRLVKG